ncbi:MAG: hypothetical protein GKS03_08055 [Alphaproteobacteria bacterium]|nr:hypothetical protein [Alphaproteobacteria bacterium]
MKSPDPNVQKALDILNDALTRDPVAITQLVNARVSCNEKLTKHKTVQTGVYSGDYKVGVLGLINGILGYKLGGIGAESDVDPKTGRLVRVRRFVHTKAGLDVRS